MCTAARTLMRLARAALSARKNGFWGFPRVDFPCFSALCGRNQHARLIFLMSREPASQVHESRTTPAFHSHRLAALALASFLTLTLALEIKKMSRACWKRCQRAPSSPATWETAPSRGTRCPAAAPTPTARPKSSHSSHPQPSGFAEVAETPACGDASHTPCSNPPDSQSTLIE